MKVSGGGRGSCRGEVAKKGKRRKQRMEGRVEREQWRAGSIGSMQQWRTVSRGGELEMEGRRSGRKAKWKGEDA